MNGAPKHNLARTVLRDPVHMLAFGFGTGLAPKAPGTAGTLAERLIEHGLSAATPVAVIENGTRPEQRVVTGHLNQLFGRLQAAGITGPALIIIGEVARQAMEDDFAAELHDAVAAVQPHALAV